MAIKRYECGVYETKTIEDVFAMAQPNIDPKMIRLLRCLHEKETMTDQDVIDVMGQYEFSADGSWDVE